ncbi:MAG TPA: hypothetical protein VK674_01115 [Candidatus Limnocylindria bacterium]|nr:hypothetical protein [Candidatus Limnocylindria bacterium]
MSEDFPFWHRIPKGEFPRGVTAGDARKAQAKLQTISTYGLEVYEKLGLPVSLGPTIVGAIWPHADVYGRDIDAIFEDQTRVPNRRMDRTAGDEFVRIWPQRGHVIVQVFAGPPGSNDYRLSAGLPFNERAFRPMETGYIFDHSDPSSPQSWTMQELVMGFDTDVERLARLAGAVATTVLDALTEGVPDP